MSEVTFESLYQADQRSSCGKILKGVITKIDSAYAYVGVGLKSDGLIAIREFSNLIDEEGVLQLKVGDFVDVAMLAYDTGYGDAHLSADKAAEMLQLEALETAAAADEAVDGVIIGRVKGGFTVALGKVLAFLPGSQVDFGGKDASLTEGTKVKVKILKLNPKKQNVVVSRRAAMDPSQLAGAESVLTNLHEGQEIKGLVKNITDYGAFVDVGGVDGLLHITDMAWKRIKHPSEVLTVGDRISVKVLKFDRATRRISLGMKQLTPDPFAVFVQTYEKGSRIKGKVATITDYGAFVELAPGVEGLVHVSEMDWSSKNVHPSKILTLGQELDVMILSVDENQRRISLGVKQCAVNPWVGFAEQHEKGDRIKGSIKSITDFGVFVGLPGNIDGLIHMSDLALTQQESEELVRQLKKGDQVEAIVLAIDAEKERISLGLKQMDPSFVEPASKPKTAKSAEETSTKAKPVVETRATMGDLFAPKKEKDSE